MSAEPEWSRDNCADEPIHIPGAIQPHGMLVAMEGDALLVTHVSDNAATWLPCEPRELLGTPLSSWLDPETREQTLAWLARAKVIRPPPHRVVFAVGGQKVPLDGVAHRYDGRLIVDLEPHAADDDDGRRVMHQTLQALSRLRASHDLQGLFDAACEEIKAVTGFGRVLIYRFDARWNGQVVAEARDDEMDSYLALHFPASDIPPQARAMYELNPLRAIPDTSYRPAQVLALPGAAARPLDLSLSMLRSVSPVHVEYMHNMGVSASLSISLVHEDRLWGIITCSSRGAPVRVPQNVRGACELLGEVVSALLGVREFGSDRAYRQRLHQVHAQLMQQMLAEGNFVHGLTESTPSLMDLANASGAAVHFNGQTYVVGRAPSDAQLQALIAWLSERPPGGRFVTASLPRDYPPAQAFRDVACGLIAIPMSRGRNNHVMWFRPEVTQAVSWGGDPGRAKQTADDGDLHPRRSFERWKQTLEGEALPWEAVELEATGEIMRGVIDLALQSGEDLAKLNAELERSNLELDAFAYAASHDLKEPLRGIHNYTSLVLRELGDAHMVGETRQRMQTVVKLTQRMEDLINSLLHYAHVGRMELATRDVDLGRLLDSLGDTLGARLGETGTRLRVARPLPAVRGDPVLLGEVFTNLITNALKYNDKAERRIEVGYDADAGRANPGWQTLFVRDNGLGIRTRNFGDIFRIFRRLHGRDKYGGGTGTGLTITKRIVERHGGKMWVESDWGVGSTFFFTLPASGARAVSRAL